MDDFRNLLHKKKGAYGKYWRLKEKPFLPDNFMKYKTK